MEIAKIILEYIRTLIWPLTVLALSVLFRGDVRRLLSRLRRAALPGGVSLDLQAEVEEVKQLSEKVESSPPPPNRRTPPGIPLTEANARMIQLGLRPTLSGLDVSYYREIAATDPVLGLAGLRIELETLARNLAKGFKIDVGERESVSRVLSRLRDAGAITGDQMSLAQKVLRLCNQAVHGRAVSREEADDVIGAVDVLARDYLSWLSWGFDDNWKPSQS